jgi:TonB family protein
LFLPSALATVVPTPAPGNSGGTARKSGNSDRSEGEVVAARVGEWLGQAAASDLVNSGRVSPVWRDVERQIDAGFHPSVGEVTRENAALSAVKQLLIGAKPESGPPVRGLDDSHAVQSDHAGFAASRAEQVAAARAAYEKPRGWKRVEIDAEVGEDGRILELRVVTPSGQHELDRAALAAVKQALERRPPHDGHVMARWAVEAAVASKLPAVGALTDEVSGKAVGVGAALSFSFDESGVKVDVPFQRTVHTRVSLLSVRKL